MSFTPEKEGVLFTSIRFFASVVSRSRLFISSAETEGEMLCILSFAYETVQKEESMSSTLSSSRVFIALEKQSVLFLFSISELIVRLFLLFIFVNMFLQYFLPYFCIF